MCWPVSQDGQIMIDCDYDMLILLCITIVILSLWSCDFVVILSFVKLWYCALLLWYCDNIVVILWYYHYDIVILWIANVQPPGFRPSQLRAGAFHPQWQPFIIFGENSFFGGVPNQDHQIQNSKSPTSSLRSGGPAPLRQARDSSTSRLFPTVSPRGDWNIFIIENQRDDGNTRIIKAM